MLYSLFLQFLIIGLKFTEFFWPTIPSAPLKIDIYCESTKIPTNTEKK